MQVQIEIDEQQKEPKIVIYTNKLTPEIQELVDNLSQEKPKILTGMQNGILEILNPKEIIRAYSATQKVYVVTETGEYTVKLRLYELEQWLDSTTFIRISNSEIINLKKVKGFNLNLVGTICVEFFNGDKTYVSRRYVSKIKKSLGI